MRGRSCRTVALRPRGRSPLRSGLAGELAGLDFSRGSGLGVVCQVDELFALADGLERKYGEAVARVEKLTPAVPAKAFRGELVPQDPEDESAERLLERIRAARASEDRYGSAGRGPGHRVRFGGGGAAVNVGGRVAARKKGRSSRASSA
jgi:type I restriction enzyme S subunit